MRNCFHNQKSSWIFTTLMTASPGLMSSLAPKNAITEMEKLLNALKNPPAKSKDEKGFKHNGWHSCTKLWIETTFMLDLQHYRWAKILVLPSKASNWNYKTALQKSPRQWSYHQTIVSWNYGDYSSTQLTKDILDWIVTNNHLFSMADEVS